LNNAILEGVFQKSNLFVITLRIEKELITLGAEMRSTIEEWFTELKKAIDLANGATEPAQLEQVQENVIPISIPDKPLFPRPDIIDTLQYEIQRLSELSKKDWNLVAVKSGCMISQNGKFYKLTIILPRLPIEIPLRALVDIENYKNWNSSLQESRKLLSINANTDFCLLRFGGLLPILDSPKNCRVMRYWGDGKMYCKCTEGFLDFVYFEVTQSEKGSMVTSYFSIHDRKYFNDYFKIRVLSSFSALKNYITQAPVFEASDQFDMEYSEDYINNLMGERKEINPWKVVNMDTGEEIKMEGEPTSPTQTPLDRTA
jgi:hypothetical protein